MIEILPYSGEFLRGPILVLVFVGFFVDDHLTLKIKLVQYNGREYAKW